MDGNGFVYISLRLVCSAQLNISMHLSFQNKMFSKFLDKYLEVE